MLNFMTFGTVIGDPEGLSVVTQLVESLPELQNIDYLGLLG